MRVFLLNKDFLLLLVALGAVLCPECLTTFFVAGAAELARVDVFHGDDIAALFHLKNGGVAIILFQTPFGMRLPAENHLTAPL